MWHRLFKANLIYALGSAFNSAALFLLAPYLVNVLTPEEYGVWALLEIAIQFLNMLTLAGLEVGLMREYWFLADGEERTRLAGSVLFTVTLWGGVLFTIGIALVLISGTLSFPGAPRALIWALGISWVEAVFSIFLTLFRIQEQAIRYVVLSVGRMVLSMGMAIRFVQSGYGLSGALLGRLSGTLLMLIPAIILGFRYVSPHIDRKLLIPVIRYGLPLFPTNLASYVLFASDRYVLQHFATLEAVAVYTFAYKLATVLDVLITRPFAIDWAPRRFKIATQRDAPSQYARILLFYLWAAVTFSLLIIALTPLFYRWLAPQEYWPGMKVVPVILLAYIIYGLSYPLNIGIMLKDRTLYLPMIGWIAAVICLGLNFWWIPIFGMWGAAWATVVAYGVWTAGVTLISLKLYHVNYSIRAIILLLGAGLIGYRGLWLLDTFISSTEIFIVGLKILWVIFVTGISGLKLWRDLRAGRKYEAQGASAS
jgi:O-antigen/teichoic acid export membrane protein